MADWVTISSLATAGGTLVLAVATFGSVRSGNRTARLAERSLLASMRPVLISSREEDPPERIMFGDRHWVTLTGHGAVAELVEDRLYFALPLRNVGSGIAHIHAWLVQPLEIATGGPVKPPKLEKFTTQMRDLYVAPGDTGFWQGAIRGTDDDRFHDGLFEKLRRQVEADDPIVIYLVYGDYEEGQRTITRFSIVRDDETGQLVSSVNRYWNVDDESVG